PVVDSLIEMWQATDEHAVNETKGVGHRVSGPSFAGRGFLPPNSVPCRWLASDEAEGQRMLAAAELDGTQIPLVVTPDGDHLVDPEIGEVAAKVGLSTVPATDFYDGGIVGGCPAGLGAAVSAAAA